MAQQEVAVAWTLWTREVTSHTPTPSTSTQRSVNTPASGDVPSASHRCVPTSGKHGVDKQRLLGKAYNNMDSDTFSVCPAEGL
jgi:hypothetical protein